jgi:hypothetical protein
MSHSVLINIIRGVFLLSIFIGMCLPVAAREGAATASEAVDQTQSTAGTIANEQAAVEQAIGKHDLGEDFAQFSSWRLDSGPTYAEHWYERYKAMKHRGRNLLAIATPVIAGVFLSAALAMFFLPNADNDWDGLLLGVAGIAVGIVGLAGALTTLTVGIVLLSISKKKLKRLQPLLLSNSPYRSSPRISFRIGPQFTGLSVRF